MSTDKYSANKTHFNFEWPKDITGLERIALTATGNLQRTLSVYFGKPITVEKIWELSATGASSTASAERPVSQVREVHLWCEGKNVCVCVSTIRMTNPHTARLFLDEKVAIGQMFRTLAVTPTFTLTNVGVEHNISGVQHLWRTYTLTTEGFSCEIREVFPDRRMFNGECWARIAFGNGGSFPNHVAAEGPDTVKAVPATPATPVKVF